MRWMGCMRFLAAVGLVGGVGLTAGPALAQAQPASGEVVTVEPNAAPPQVVYTDAAITSDIKAKMDASQMLKHSEIDIVTAAGVVTLVGVVPSDFARARAVELAKSTPGVVRVDNMLRLNVASPEAPSQN
jgi:hyperosmotically inducible periplasmic protein